MTKKQVIRLTESDLHRIIKESVNKILKESSPYDPDGSLYDAIDRSLSKIATDAYVSRFYSDNNQITLAVFRTTDRQVRRAIIDMMSKYYNYEYYTSGGNGEYVMMTFKPAAPAQVMETKQGWLKSKLGKPKTDCKRIWHTKSKQEDEDPWDEPVHYTGGRPGVGWDADTMPLKYKQQY